MCVCGGGGIHATMAVRSPVKTGIETILLPLDKNRDQQFSCKQITVSPKAVPFLSLFAPSQVRVWKFLRFLVQRLHRVQEISQMGLSKDICCTTSPAARQNFYKGTSHPPPKDQASWSLENAFLKKSDIDPNFSELDTDMEIL